MRRLLPILVFLLWPGLAPAQDSVAVPWVEFRQLYRESIERDIRKQTETTPFVYTLSEAEYALTVGDGCARGEVRIAGKVVSGPRRAIPLFGPDMVVAAVGTVTGGDLLCGEAGDRRVCFFPAEQAGEFQVALSFLTPVRDEGNAQSVAFAVPTALRNTLRVALPAGARLLQAPGIAGGDGAYSFAPTSSTLRIRFLAKPTDADTPIEVATFTRIALQGNRLVLTTTCAPERPLTEPFAVTVPEGARFAASSLGASSVQPGENGALLVTAPPGDCGPFWLRFALEAPEADATLSIALPRIARNTGSEGDFAVEDPADGQIAVAGERLAPPLPVARLTEDLRPAAGSDRVYRHTEPDRPIRVSLARFEALATAAAVLDEVFLFASFEESGNCLTTLAMEVPASAGPRLRLPPVRGASIWSLTVNGEPRKVLSDAEGAWIVPLADGTPSRVEIAFLRQGEPLGLRGSLEALVPALELPAQRICVAVGLPPRVQLLSIEGPVSPARGEAWKAPRGFAGVPHYFSRSFHKGEEIRLQLAYKEPVKPETQTKGESK